MCHCSECKGQSLSHDQTIGKSLVENVVEDSVGCDETDNIVMGNLAEYVTSIKCNSRFAHLRPRFHCLSKFLLQEVVSKRKEISTVSDLMTNFPIFSKVHAEEILKIISP